MAKQDSQNLGAIKPNGYKQDSQNLLRSHNISDTNSFVRIAIFTK
jgi:hypothetical protein